MSQDSGFGPNFYGYFAFAIVWVCAYFVWAWLVNARERKGLTGGATRAGLKGPEEE